MAGSDIQAAGSRSSPWRHAPEYLIEAVGLGIFLWAAVGLTVLLEHPDSALRAAVPDPFVRRGCMGIAMGATAVALVYSPWGKRSGAHFNPALTFAFFRLGRIAPVDALCYALAQFAGALAGIAAAGLVFGPLPSDQAVRFAATLPGAAGPASAFAAELAISFGLMLLVLVASNSPRLAPYTGILCGLLIATYITLEAP
ncbi:MAG TPA: aquaporin, partial [Myxococcota bacterium]|nr:aquaporin [Myxococcota bacterium]